MQQLKFLSEVCRNNAIAGESLQKGQICHLIYVNLYGNNLISLKFYNHFS